MHSTSSGYSTQSVQYTHVPSTTCGTYLLLPLQLYCCPNTKNNFLNIIQITCPPSVQHGSSLKCVPFLHNCNISRRRLLFWPNVGTVDTIIFECRRKVLMFYDAHPPPRHCRLCPCRNAQRHPVHCLMF